MSIGILFACDGCFTGAPAVISLVLAVLALIGSIYMLLWSNLGARQAYLVTVVALAGWMMLLSALWLFGAPGTTTSTGPRGREPVWVPFTPTSEVAKLDFPDLVAAFPDGAGWKPLDQNHPEANVYPGKIDVHGDFGTLAAVVEQHEAALAAKQKTGSTKPDDWKFFPASLKPATADEAKLPKAEVRFLQDGDRLLFGAVIPATATHPETKVFAYRDKGLVYLTALEFLLASLLLFISHLWLLARYEDKKKREDENASSPVRETALVG